MRLPIPVLPFVLVGALMVSPSGQAAEPGADAAEYEKCLRLARVSPNEGLAEAMAWVSMNGGEPASHCAAIAMIALRQFEEGASRLEALAADSPRSPRLRAAMLDQAAQAWMLDRNPERSEQDVDKALQLVPGAPDLLVDRAIARAEQKNYQGALHDLDQSLTDKPGRADALTYRASAKRHLGDRAGAASDLAAALAADPSLPETWLEKGILAAEEGDGAAAKEAFTKTIALDPDTAAAATARQDLDILDKSAR